MSYTTDRFLEWVYDNAPKGKDLDQAHSGNFYTIAAQKREQLRKLFTLDVLEGYNFEDSFMKLGTIVRDGYTIEVYDYELLPYLNTHFYILKPDAPKMDSNGQLKTVIYSRGHGDECMQVKLIDNDSEDNPYYPKRLVKAGYTVFVPEFVAYSDSYYEGFNGDDTHKKCFSIYTNLQMAGISLLGLRIYHTMKTIDYIQSRYETDIIGSMGFSGGGTVSEVLCALDDRITAGIIGSYGNTYKDSILSIRHCICNYTQGILNVCEEPEMIALSAPKPLLMVSGKTDPIFPVEGVKKAYHKAKELYSKVGLGDRIELLLFDGGHQHTNEDFVSFFDRYL